MIGQTLGQYRIEEKLGEGGMGKVYRARDSRLGRHVAIKVLPENFGRDPERLARLTREARVLAALNHPNIAAIYQLEQAEGRTFLVLELVEGENLRVPLPLNEALSVARQITEALEAAHEKGIVHRDLKPANIKVTPERKVKVLDFGLAKALQEPVETDQSQSTTISMATTRADAIVGTPAYMSPEQAAGQPVDKRTDIWSFGCVLYEMLAGRRAFGGQTIIETLSAVAKAEPEWARLPPATPNTVRQVLNLCLKKEPSHRLHHIVDARILIEHAEIPSGISTTRRAPRGLILAGAVVLAASIMSFYLGRRSGAEQPQVARPLTHTAIDLTANAQLALGIQVPLTGFDSPVIALSRDGRYLAYVGQSPSGTMLYLRESGALTVRPVTGTEGAIYAFFSPDTRWLGFLTNDKVKKVPLHSGAPSILCDARQPIRASWTLDDTIYFIDVYGGRISRVAAAGGGPTVVAAASGSFSQVLPNGEWALMTNWTRGISADYAEVVLRSLTTGESRVLIRAGYDARYIPPNHVMFGRGGDLFAVRFNPTRGEIEGDPFPLVSGVSMVSLWGQVHAAISENGLIAYVPGGDLAIGRLAWVDRQGRTEFLAAPARLYSVFDLAPDGERLAVHVADVTDYIWIYDLKRGEGRRLTAGKHSGWPVWNPDSRTVAFSGWETLGRHSISTQPADGGGEAREILAPSQESRRRSPSSWSADHRVLALDRWGGVSFLSLSDAEVRPPDPSPNEWGADFSPDGRWVAYVSEELGRAEIFVRSFPEASTVRQISTEGGVEPVWCPCGELFWRHGNRWMSVVVRTQPALSWDPPQFVFQTDFIDTEGRSYDVSSDGKRLLVVKRAEPYERSRIYLVTNWMEKVLRR
jgi:hypothetical protein